MEFMLIDYLKHHLVMLQMFGPIGDVDQNFIKEDENKTSNKGLKNIIHQGLEGGRCICKTKWYDKNSKCPWCIRNAVLQNSSAAIRT